MKRTAILGLLLVLGAGCFSYPRNSGDYQRRSKIIAARQASYANMNRPAISLPPPIQKDVQGDTGTDAPPVAQREKKRFGQVNMVLKDNLPERTAVSYGSEPPPPTAGVGRKIHRQFKNDDEELRFLKVVAQKQAALNEMQALSSLFKQKEVQHQQINSQLLDQFGIQFGKNYQYQADSQSVYLVGPSGGEAPSRPLSLHRKLVNDKEIGQFMALVKARQAAKEELLALHRMYREKRVEVDALDEELVATYAIEQDRKYQYDATSKTLFESTSLPPKPPKPPKTGEADEAVLL